MTLAVLLCAPLALPAGDPTQSYPLRIDSLLAQLEALEGRGTTGRLELRADGWLAELLMLDGRPLAAGLVGTERSEPAFGEAALQSLVDQGDLAWQGRVDQLEPAAARALAGLAGPAESLDLTSQADLRHQLRRLADSGQTGVLHLAGDERWARILLEAGRVLGVYTDDSACLTPTLAPLAEVLSDPELRADWHAASGGPPLDLPTAEAALPVSPLERQLVWIVSRFEAGWSRAREERGTRGELVATLREMAEALSTLAALAEATGGDPASLESEISALPLARALPQDQAQIGARLGAAGRTQALPTLVEIVSEALRRIVRASAEPSVATCCRQAAGVLEAELRAAFAPSSDSTSEPETKSESGQVTSSATSSRAGGDA